jgi:zinc resistance-associated protein
MREKVMTTRRSKIGWSKIEGLWAEGSVMLKAILVGTTALAIMASSVAYAQQRPGREGDTRRWQPRVEDIQALGEARLAALKAGLALTVEQEKAWAPFAAAARDLIKLRSDRFSAAAERGNSPARTTDPIERLRQRSTAMSETGAALQKLVEAADPLYKSLDDGQKRRFAMLSRLGDPRRDGAGRELGGRGGEGPRGFERDPRRSERDGRYGYDRDPGGREGYGPERGPRGGDGDRFSRGPGRFGDDGFDRDFRRWRGERFDRDRGPGRFEDYRDERGPRRSEGYGFDRGPRRFEDRGYERGPRRFEDNGYQRGPRRFEDDRSDRDRRGRTTGGPDANGPDTNGEDL